MNTDQVNFLCKPTEEMLGEERPDLVSRGKPVRVDELDAANAWGLRHMSGNVSEQTLSCRTETYAGWETSGPYLQMAREPASEMRVVRGGAYWTAMDFSRVAVRGSAGVKSRSSTSGFRVLRDLRSTSQ